MLNNLVNPNPMRRAIHWPSVDFIEPGLWPFRFFTPEEIRSKGDGSILVDYAALEQLDRLRDRLGVPVFVTSAYRDHAHNAAVGSQPTSLHRQGRAFDIWTNQHEPWLLANEARLFGWPGIGLYENFVHVDDGAPRTWGLSF